LTIRTLAIMFNILSSGDPIRVKYPPIPSCYAVYGETCTPCSLYKITIQRHCFVGRSCSNILHSCATAEQQPGMPVSAAAIARPLQNSSWACLCQLLQKLGLRGSKRVALHFNEEDRISCEQTLPTDRLSQLRSRINYLSPEHDLSLPKLLRRRWQSPVKRSATVIIFPAAALTR